ncbi:MAG: DUF1080 domain-containing protein [Planctomycetes bacterium]|nr:DUF1080 domain-containing protein [Planctomycetota bacterium]MBM4057236.1 DUF1080 domain-containing protein [Planctomycetota bacterium]
MNRPLAAVFAGLVFVIRSVVAEPAASPAAAGWQSLFNGRDLTGWDGDPRLWSVRDGVIHGETTAEQRANGNTFLIAQGLELTDFELELSFRCGDRNNSGIQYRSRHVTTGNPPNAWVVQGYQHEIRNSAKPPNVAGFIYDEGGRRGRICLVGEQAEWTAAGKRVTGQLIDAAGFEKLFRVNDWNDVRIVAEGTRLRHILNGTAILEFTDDPAVALRSGVLALQLHGGQPMWAEYRGIRVRPRPAAE